MARKPQHLDGQIIGHDTANRRKMNKYESTVKYANAPIERVYAMLSDLTSLEVIRQNISNPAYRQMVMEKAGDKVKPEQLDQIEQRLKEMVITPDSITADAGPMGQVTLNIVERETNKLVKLEAVGLPMAANIWIQMLDNGDGRTAIKATIGAEMNFLIKQMLKGKLQKGAEGLADMLAMLPY